jgi:hypothetical protein
MGMENASLAADTSFDLPELQVCGARLGPTPEGSTRFFFHLLKPFALRRRDFNLPCQALKVNASSRTDVSPRI